MGTRTGIEVRSSHLRAFVRRMEADRTRVTLVPEQAVLLAGDRVDLEIHVDAGCAVEIVEPGGTVAYGMRGGQAAWDVRLRVDEGASLLWRGQPFVVAEGATVVRRTEVDVDASASLVLRETLVLGRHGEKGGDLVARTHVARGDETILVEELDARRGLAPFRILDQVLRLNTGAAPTETSLVLESGDILDRWLGDSLHLSPLGSRCS